MDENQKIELLKKEIKFWRDEVGIYEEDNGYTRRPRPPSCRCCAAHENQPHHPNCAIDAVDKTEVLKE